MSKVLVIIVSYLLALFFRFSFKWLCDLTQKPGFIPILLILFLSGYFYLFGTTLIILHALSRIPETAIETARDVGANKWQIFRAIILPMTYKACLIGMVLLLI
ncbi:ABC transporter permease subunit [Jeotgalibaca sp. A122]|uniref:ABC transporter permease subunit n=1 Tax=Jeotgalibaca sp. A122 TaxID=3457322 RepID=UPI003FD545C8